MLEAGQSLQRLLLDADDTFVTRATATALLQREDEAGLRLVARALGAADANHADWILTAVQDGFAIFASRRDAAAQTCEALIAEADPLVRRGAAQLRDALTEINPVLRP